MPYYRHHLSKLKNGIDKYLETDSVAYRNNELHKTYQLSFGEEGRCPELVASAFSFSPESYQQLLEDRTLHRTLIEAREDKNLSC